MSQRTSPTGFPSTTATLYSAAISGNEQGLVQERLLLAAILEEAQDAILSSTLDGIVTTWNHAAERLFGYSAGEIIGLPNSMFMAPADLIQEEMLVEYLCQGNIPAPFETVWRHKSGEALPVMLTLSPVKNAVGEVVGVSTIARITLEPRQIDQDRKQEGLLAPVESALTCSIERSKMTLAADQAVQENHADALVNEKEERPQLHAFTSAAETLKQTLRTSYDATVASWSRLLELCDKEAEGHNQRVTSLMVLLAKHVGMDEDEILYAKWGAQLHDIGKMAIPDEILHKRGPLDVEEWIEIRRHPAIAYEMLAPIAFVGPALNVPYSHHEKWDGTGYPRALRGTAIPYMARLFAVIDVYDALCSDRTYRDGWPEHRVREYLRTQAGSHFDPQVVDAFLEMLELQDEQNHEVRTPSHYFAFA